MSSAAANYIKKKKILSKLVAFYLWIPFFSSPPLWAGVPSSSLAHGEAQARCSPSSWVSCVSSLHPAQTPAGIKGGVNGKGRSTASQPPQGSGASVCFPARSRLCEERCRAGDSSEEVSKLWHSSSLGSDVAKAAVSGSLHRNATPFFRKATRGLGISSLTDAKCWHGLKTARWLRTGRQQHPLRRAWSAAVHAEKLKKLSLAEVPEAFILYLKRSIGMPLSGKHGLKTLSKKHALPWINKSGLDLETKTKKDSKPMCLLR